MANVDRPNGFKFIKTMSGAPVSGMIRSVGVADGADIFVGDALELASGLAQRFTVGDECLGVAVGFGKKNDMTLEHGGSFNPDDLMTRYYDDSANTHTDWVVYYIPAADAIFEAQMDDAETAVVGEAYDVLIGSGNTTTGMSDMEIDHDALTTTGDVVVVEIPNYPDNDPTAAYGRYWVKFVKTEFNNN